MTDAELAAVLELIQQRSEILLERCSAGLSQSLVSVAGASVSSTSVAECLGEGLSSSEQLIFVKVFGTTFQATNIACSLICQKRKASEFCLGHIEHCGSAVSVTVAVSWSDFRLVDVNSTVEPLRSIFWTLKMVCR